MLEAAVVFHGIVALLIILAVVVLLAAGALTILRALGRGARDATKVLSGGRRARRRR